MDAYKAALIRRERLKAELREIDDFIRLYERFSKLADAAGEGARTDAQPPSPLEEVPEQKENERRSYGDGYGVLSDDLVLSGGRIAPDSTTLRVVRGQEFYDIARAILLETGHPLSRTNLLNEFEARGVTVTGSQKANNVGTLMWRAQDAFTNIERYGYWPADVAYEPAKYVPPANDPAGNEGQGNADEGEKEGWLD